MVHGPKILLTFAQGVPMVVGCTPDFIRDNSLLHNGGHVEKLRINAFSRRNLGVDENAPANWWLFRVWGYDSQSPHLVSPEMESSQSAGNGIGYQG